MTAWVWIVFVVFILGMLALDLGVLHRKAHVIHTTEALLWTAVWIVLALAFNVGVYYLYEQPSLDLGIGTSDDLSGRQAALQFFTGYLIEKSLSLDNIMVIALIFTYFKVPAIHQHRVLFWGVLGALIMRGVMIGAGAVLIQRFSWMIYVFGGLLLLTAVKLLIVRDDNIEPDRNVLVRAARRFLPVTSHYEGERFFTRADGRRAMTPLFIVLLVVESTDLLFAIDSIPAIFAITRDPFLVFTSNVFAILGLRSLYFALAGLMDRFRYLKMSLVFILAFVGVKMILSHHYPVPTGVSLAFIGGIILVGVLASMMASHRDTARLRSPIPGVSESDTPPEDLTTALEPFAEAAFKQLRRVFVILVGSTLLLVGLALLVLPGPGLVVIGAGLAILSAEFLWARLLLRRVKKMGLKLANSLMSRSNDGGSAD